jgi:hypothetical protein
VSRYFPQKDIFLTLDGGERSPLNSGIFALRIRAAGTKG